MKKKKKTTLEEMLDFKWKAQNGSVETLGKMSLMHLVYLENYLNRRASHFEELSKEAIDDGITENDFFWYAQELSQRYLRRASNCRMIAGYCLRVREFRNKLVENDKRALNILEAIGKRKVAKDKKKPSRWDY